MKQLTRTLLIASTLLFSAAGLAQADDTEKLKLAAVEALITAPPERAIPMASKVLEGNNSEEVKTAALFILSQFNTPESKATLTRIARQEGGELQLEAIRMIGIGGGEATAVAIEML